MSDDIWARAEIESPCVKVCVMHRESDLCMGCYRNRQELALWGSMSSEERKAIMAELPGRAHLVKGQRRKRGPRP
ncbi:DUF1289 domain-containing protein [Amylibacter marinus]|uniref:DUF1289 domain-containing protein n=1 Tax=Amylibacter marinus TaxID=1475483 RepID=A0ABQ5VU37_9RHOB|nr:DUF1289 domain-containing protein [Amylibacter marinus]GLQ34830.1 DUF1289 domain-containing protein [Amylibacter marinus]